MKIGFIGLGIMGKPMAKNLIKAGHLLSVYDINQKSIDELVGFGAKDGKSIKNIAENHSLIITMLPNSPQVKEVVIGENGILSSAKEGSTIIDMSSIAPKAAQDVAISCLNKNVVYIDAPVSGGEPKAIDGTLSIMVGGDKESFEKFRDDVLLKMGASAVYCGKSGAGNTTKLANQIIVALNIAAVSEAFTLSTKAGVDPQLVFDAIKGGLAGSTVMNAKVPMIINKNFKPGFKIALHIKDLNNAIETGTEFESPLPLTVMVMEMLKNLKADGLADLDHSAIAKYYSKLSGCEI